MSKKSFVIYSLCLILGILVGMVVDSPRTIRNDSGKVIGLEEHKNNLAVQLKIENGEGGMMNFENLSLKSGGSALDLLRKVAQEEGFGVVTEEQSFGEYIVSIGGQKQDARHFWSFIVNGEMAQVGAGTYEVKDGDIIEFRWVKM